MAAYKLDLVYDVPRLATFQEAEQGARSCYEMCGRFRGSKDHDLEPEHPNRWTMAPQIAV
jgi:hypothetical protein